jgi:hypothetical protein
MKEIPSIEQKFKEVKSGKYVIVKINSEAGLYTRNLGSDIAYVWHSKELGKTALARQLD